MLTYAPGRGRVTLKGDAVPIRGLGSRNVRDDFSPAVKEILAKRVGFRCSNPVCRQRASATTRKSLGRKHSEVSASRLAWRETFP